ncbi:alpha/beta hydrolase [Frondihabitans sp. PAMC 28766]|uniref:alpha/beta hydrolase n=1 Tax=Frondihabitans sp. PAMC 28766 TaxID=1795630 RepID=UPI0012FF6C90|nr:alpha/beta hydrolase [Frondihabitans sp. PAMC 28766]
MQQLVAHRADQVAESWSGTAHTAWSRNAAEVVVAWARLHTWADNERDALRRYVDAIQSIKERARRQQMLMTAAHEAASQPLDFLDPETLTRRRQDLDDDLLATTASTTAALNALALERQQAEDDLARSLHSVHLELDRSGHAILPAGMSLAKLASLDTASLLGVMGSLSATELDELVSADPSLTQDFWNDPPPADDVAAWWASLSEQQQAELITGAPAIIGNLGGVPFSTRIDANRQQLDVAGLRDDLTKEQRATVDEAMRAVASADGPAGRGLLDLNLENAPPLAAVAIGNMDTAQKVTWAVPGMNTWASSLSGWLGPCAALYNEQIKIDPSTHAVVAWIGYATPDLTASEQHPTSSSSVLMNTRAINGAERLASELDGIRFTRRASPPDVSVVAHSYGTTTAAYALTRTRFDVKTVTLVASAGIDASAVPNARALHVDVEHGQPQVFSTQAKRDFIATIGRTVRPDVIDDVVSYLSKKQPTVAPNHRIAPDNHFGALPFSVEGGPEGSESSIATAGHDAFGSGGLPIVSAPTGQGYFDSGTQSLHNIAATSTGTRPLIASPVRPFVWPIG